MGKISLLTVPFARWYPVPRIDTAGYDLSGKVVLLVGGCSGIGLEISRHLARMNPAILVVTGRNTTVGEKVVSGMSSISLLR